MKVKGDRKCKIYIVVYSVSISLIRYETQLSQNGKSEDVYVSNETNNFFVLWPGSKLISFQKAPNLSSCSRSI